jgi:hypothetical protein
MTAQPYPVQSTGVSVIPPRRLPGFWRWLTRVLWGAVFLCMVGLNGAAIVAHVERNASGMDGGAAGLKAVFVAGHGWVLTVDASGPAAQAGIRSGDQLLAVDGVEITPDATFQAVNRHFFGKIGAPLTLTVERGHDTVGEETVTLVEEDVLHIWRRFRVPLGIRGDYLPALEAALLVGYLLTSALIFWRRSDDWLALYLTITLVLITPQLSYSWYYLGLTAAYWEVVFRLIIAIAVALTLPNFYLLPNGKFVPRWTFLPTIAWVIFSISTELFPASSFSIYNWSGAEQLGVWLGWYATGMLAQIYRYRYEATPTERQQIKWVGFGLTVAVIVNLGWTLAFELFPVLSHAGEPHRWMWLIGRPVYVLGMMVLPISFGIAVFRYRLWDIDNLINRTLVYGTLTAVIVGVYIVVVSIFDVLFSSNGQVLSQIAAIALDLIIFEPLRDRLQRGVDHLMFGESDDLPAVVARLGQRLSMASGPEVVLPLIVETVAESLKLPYVAITLAEGDSFHLAAAYGTPLAAYFTWPLVYQRQTVGQLILAQRAAGEPFKPAEWQLIESLAYQVSAAVHDLLLENKLQQSYMQAQGDTG